MRVPLTLATGWLFFMQPLQAQTADEIIAKYLKTIGGANRLAGISTLRRSGKFIGSGGFEASVRQENKRPDRVREEFSLQGMTGVNAWDGRNGWKIEPWDGKKDPEPLGEDELKEILEDADFDGPLVDYARKGYKVEYQGSEPVEGTDSYKLRVTSPSGDVHTYFMDSDSFVPIKIETKRIVRGAERESETILGDYKEVNGVFFPFSFESGRKGSTSRAKITYSRIEANVPMADNRFEKPGAAGKPPEQRQGQPVDASQTKPNDKKSDDTQPSPPPAKPPHAPASESQEVRR